MTVTLDELSAQLNISPSGLRKRIHALGLEVEKGSRGKWLIPDELRGVLEEADRLMKGGAGAATTRRVLGITMDSPITDPAPGEDSGEGAIPDEGGTVHQTPSPVSDRSSTGEELRQALALLAEERVRSETLQVQLVDALGELADTKGKVGMFQERSLNLAETVKQLENKVLMLEAPKDESAPPRSWWHRLLGSGR